MLDFEQQANQAQALASLDEDWHLLEGERTTFAIFILRFLSLAFSTRTETVSSTLDRRAPGENAYREFHVWLTLAYSVWRTIISRTR